MGRDRRRHPTLWPAGAGLSRPPPFRGLTVLLAIALILTSLLLANLSAGNDLGPRRLLANPLNWLIAWADLNLELWPRQGAERAVRLDPEFRIGLGRQAARWFATKGTIHERLHYAAELTERDRRELPLLRAAIEASLCAPERRLRKAAVAAARSAGLAKQLARKGARRC